MKKKLSFILLLPVVLFLANPTFGQKLNLKHMLANWPWDIAISGTFTSTGTGATTDNTLADSLIVTGQVSASTGFTDGTMTIDGSGNFSGVNTFAADSVEFNGTVTLANNVTAGTKTFTNSGASADTIVVTGGTANSLYIITWTSDPGAPADWWVTAKADTLILNTGAAVTGTPSFAWFRMEKN